MLLSNRLNTIRAISIIGLQFSISFILSIQIEVLNIKMTKYWLFAKNTDDMTVITL